MILNKWARIYCSELDPEPNLHKGQQSIAMPLVSTKKQRNYIDFYFDRKSHFCSGHQKLFLIKIDKAGSI